MAARPGGRRRFMPHPQAAAGRPIGRRAGCPVNSDERRAARRERREQERARRRAARLEGCTLEAVADLAALEQAARAAKRGVGWKASVQRYDRDRLLNVLKARRDLLDGADIRRGFHEFDLYESGKLRHICSVHFSERVVHKSLSQNALVPALTASFVRSNTANTAGRGTSDAMRIIKRDLARHWRAHGAEGYVLLVDFSDYFAKIDHGAMKAVVARALDDPRLVSLAGSLIDAGGERGLGLGSEPNQVMAVALPGRVDHMVCETCAVEAYGRYMDDSYAIHASKEHLRWVLGRIRECAGGLGIEINERKTRIVKLSHGFTWLKKKWSYSPTGKVVVRPCRESITRERRKLKAHARMVEGGRMTFEQARCSYASWRGSMEGLDARRSVRSMDALYRELFGVRPPS